MDSEEIINMLDNINSFLEAEDYEKAKDYIERQKIYVLAQNNPVEDYMNKLVGNLK